MTAAKRTVLHERLRLLGARHAKLGRIVAIDAYVGRFWAVLFCTDDGMTSWLPTKGVKVSGLTLADNDPPFMFKASLLVDYGLRSDVYALNDWLGIDPLEPDMGTERPSLYAPQGSLIG